MDLPQILPFINGSDLAPCGKVAGDNQTEILIEMRFHLADPLAYDACGSNYEDALDQPADLEFAQHQPGLNGLAQTYFIGQQIANALARHSTRQCVNLMG